MAKISKGLKKVKIEPVKPWLANKMAEARKLNEHRAARAAQRWQAPAGVALLILITLSSLFLPQDNFQKIKAKLFKNPNDFHAQISLAEELLANNQFKEAEKALLLAENQMKQTDRQVLGEQTDLRVEELWQKKFHFNPKDIEKLVAAWEKIIEEKPGYRDGHLQVAYLYYQLYENEKAKEALKQAIELDPNYQPARELEKLIQ
jgi:tetratricopeptide (TPR) repeat protein